jgi:hypothetical protein
MQENCFPHRLHLSQWKFKLWFENNLTIGIVERIRGYTVYNDLFIFWLMRILISCDI